MGHCGTQTAQSTREIRIGTWREHDGTSLKALRDERDRLATELRSGIDPIERKATERLASQAAQAEAVQQLRHMPKPPRQPILCDGAG
jgi:hypothetical protein